MASLFVIQGADQGKRFEFKSSPVALGRDNSNAIRLHDTEVSRRHAELRQEEESYRIVDLGSANGTFVNGQPIDQAPLHSGDRLQLGQTVLLYNEGVASPKRDLTARVDLLSKSSPDDRSAILKSIPSGEGSRVLQKPDGAGGLAPRAAGQPLGHVPDHPGDQPHPRDRLAPCLRSSSSSSSRSGPTEAPSC